MTVSLKTRTTSAVPEQKTGISRIEDALALIPVIETERLIMGPPSLETFETEIEFFETERSGFVGGPLEPSLVWRAIASLVGHWVFRGYGFWSLTEKATGAYAGRCGLWYPDGWPEPEIGWTLMGHAEGRGLAYEAALAARSHAYDTLGWTTAISLIAAENERSQALAQRMGALRESPFTHPVFGEMDIWRHPDPLDAKRYQ